MSCAVCGEETLAGALFCHACGSLVEPVPMLPARAASAHASRPAPGRSDPPPSNVLHSRPSGVLPRARPASASTSRPPRRRGWGPAWSPLVAMAVLVLLLLVALAASPMLVGLVARMPGAVIAQSCLEPLDPRAGAAIRDPLLAAAVQREGGAFLPVVPTRTFHAGQRMFLTFQLATQAKGRLDARFCIASAVITGSLGVSPDLAGHTGEFSVSLPTSMPAGTVSCVAVLLWNGRIAARLPFSVS